MNELIIKLITIVLTLILGVLSKKCKFISNNLIPLQNLLIGFIIALIEWYFTKDFETAIALSGLLAGGTYDLIHNLNKIVNKKDEFEEYRQEELNADETEIGELEEEENV
ncbi:MAG: hypothetical protein IKD74_03610 [Clostridia bacterium]|nr:hypothetical protein [Clostridia bacterium]